MAAPETMSRLALPLVGAVTLGVGACGTTSMPPVEVEQVEAWMTHAYTFARIQRLSPPVAARTFAYAAVALHESFTAVEGRGSFAGLLHGLDSLPSPPGRRPLDPAVVAHEAERTVFEGLTTGGWQGSLALTGALADSLIELRREQGVPDDVVDRSMTYGAMLGEAVLAWASRDGFDSVRDRPYVLPEGPDQWRPTPDLTEYRPIMSSRATDFVLLDDPTASFDTLAVADRVLLSGRPAAVGGGALAPTNVTMPMEPHWSSLRVSALPDADACPVAPPEPYSIEPGSAFWEENAEVLRVSRELTPWQRETAFYWADDPGKTGTPPGHWVRLAAATGAAAGLGARPLATVYAAAAIGMADSFIIGWRDKYRWNVVRPVRYIREQMEPGWRPVIPTPPFPEYPSGHSFQSAAAARVLDALAGGVPVVDDTHVELGMDARRYDAFGDAAAEAAMSRLYGGIHYPMAVENGQRQGRCVGDAVLERLRPALGPVLDAPE